ncbi:MAG TPA: PadR family transcriptional regulator [Vicinamibacterales bacterium]|nr:PadR family transcriptional regulator [Vicinamibacterales bacterium]
MPRALSSATALVIDALARGCRHGFDILDATGLASGTVYPILRRLEQDGLATSRWESARVAQQEQRPPRRYYALTRDGQTLVEEARARFPMLTAAAVRGMRRA